MTQPTEQDRFVAGPVWAEADAGEDGETIYTAEIQAAGGYSVIATVHADTEALAIERRDLILSSLQPNPRVKALVEAATSAAGWFRDYERQHAAKGTDDGDRKARVNATRAAHLESALSTLEKSDV